MSGIQDHISLAVDKNGSIHIAFVGYTGSGLSSNRGVCYGFYNGSWTFTNVEMHSDPHGWLNIYTPIISLDKNGTPYICYVLKDANTFTAYLKVASSSNSWSPTTVQSLSETGGDQFDYWVDFK